MVDGNWPALPMIELAERLRRERRDRHARRPHPLGKRFTLEEMRANVAGYKNVHIGRTRRMPARGVVLQIAAYLECEPHEREALLTAAGYVSERDELNPGDFVTAIERGLALLEGIPLPASLVTAGWVEERVNLAYMSLFPDCQAVPWKGREGAAIPWYFAATGAQRPYQAPDEATGLANLRSICRLFRHMHRGLETKPWYQDMLAEFETIDAFKTVWRQGDPGTDPMQLGVTTQLQSGTRRIFREQQVIMPLSAAAFPLILICLPIDDAARELYASRGIACVSAATTSEPADQPTLYNISSNVHRFAQRASISSRRRW